MWRKNISKEYQNAALYVEFKKKSACFYLFFAAFEQR